VNRRIAHESAATLPNAERHQRDDRHFCLELEVGVDGELKVEGGGELEVESVESVC
jgi:hypothetical protein